MSDDSQNLGLIKSGIGLYALIFALILVDLVSDYQEGIEWSHVLVELLVLLVAIVGLSLLIYNHYQATQQVVQHLQHDLQRSQQQAAQWQAESRVLIQGLASKIQAQFKQWQLTKAESEIGFLLLKGFSHQEIANLRQASERTVREQARSLYKKAGLASRTELSAFFLEDLLIVDESD